MKREEQFCISCVICLDESMAVYYILLYLFRPSVNCFFHTLEYHFCMFSRFYCSSCLCLLRQVFYCHLSRQKLSSGKEISVSFQTVIIFWNCSMCTRESSPAARNQKTVCLWNICPFKMKGNGNDILWQIKGENSVFTITSNIESFLINFTELYHMKSLL